MRHSDGHLLGILSVDEPVSRRRPTDEELDVLVSLADTRQNLELLANRSPRSAALNLPFGAALTPDGTMKSPQDLRAVFTAATHAQRAADYLHQLQPSG